MYAIEWISCVFLYERMPKLILGSFFPGSCRTEYRCSFSRLSETCFKSEKNQEKRKKKKQKKAQKSRGLHVTVCFAFFPFFLVFSQFIGNSYLKRQKTSVARYGNARGLGYFNLFQPILELLQLMIHFIKTGKVVFFPYFYLYLYLYFYFHYLCFVFIIFEFFY